MTKDEIMDVLWILTEARDAVEQRQNARATHALDMARKRLVDAVKKLDEEKAHAG